MKTDNNTVSVKIHDFFNKWCDKPITLEAKIVTSMDTDCGIVYLLNCGKTLLTATNSIYEGYDMNPITAMNYSRTTKLETAIALGFIPKGM
jgi:hypothetical protein